MDFQVLLSKEALSDLEGILGYIAQHNAEAAARVGDELLDAGLGLAVMPERGRVVPEFGRSELREIVLRSYRIIYRVDAERKAVEIVRFWHAARGFPHIPRALG